MQTPARRLLARRCSTCCRPRSQPAPKMIRIMMAPSQLPDVRFVSRSASNPPAGPLSEPCQNFFFAGFQESFKEEFREDFRKGFRTLQLSNTGISRFGVELCGVSARQVPAKNATKHKPKHLQQRSPFPTTKNDKILSSNHMLHITALMPRGCGSVPWRFQSLHHRAGSGPSGPCRAKRPRGPCPAAPKPRCRRTCRTVPRRCLRRPAPARRPLPRQCSRPRN